MGKRGSQPAFFKNNSPKLRWRRRFQGCISTTTQRYHVSLPSKKIFDICLWLTFTLFVFSGDPSTFNVDTGHVWSRVTEAANVITGVGKVLASGLASYSGGDEEGPHLLSTSIVPNIHLLILVEPDNHLTNVLRAYHLAKAASPSDLPDWLFTERERRLPGFQQSEASSEGQARGDRLAQTSETSYRRDIHRTQYLERTFEQPPEPTYRRESPSQSSQSRAFGDRLRDLRKVPGASSIPSRRQY